MTVRLVVELEPGERQAFKAAAAAEGVSMSVVVRRLVAAYTAGDIEHLPDWGRPVSLGEYAQTVHGIGDASAAG